MASGEARQGSFRKAQLSRRELPVLFLAVTRSPISIQGKRRTEKKIMQSPISGSLDGNQCGTTNLSGGGSGYFEHNSMASRAHAQSLPSLAFVISGL